MKSYFNYNITNIVRTYNDEAGKEAVLHLIDAMQKIKFKDELLSKSDKDIPDFLEYHLRHYIRQDGNYYEWIYEVENIIKFLELNEKQRDAVRCWIEQDEEINRQVKFLKKNLSNLNDFEDKKCFLLEQKKQAQEFIDLRLTQPFVAKFGTNQRKINPAKEFIKEIEKQLFLLNKLSDGVIYFSYRFGKEKALSKYQINVGNPVTIDKGKSIPLHPTDLQLWSRFKAGLYDTDINEIEDFLDFHFNQFEGEKIKWWRYVKSRLDDTNFDYKTKQQFFHPANEYIYEWFEKNKTELEKKTKEKSHNKIIPESFTLTDAIKEKYKPKKGIANTTLENALGEMLKDLKKTPQPFVDEETTLPQFKKLFIGDGVQNKITWKGSVGELHCYIDLLHLSKINDLKNDIWEVTLKCFSGTNAKGKPFTNDMLRNAYKTQPTGARAKRLTDIAKLL